MSTTLRLSDDLQVRAAGLARSLGISLNALVAVALADYLDARSAAAASVSTLPRNAVEPPKGSAVGVVSPAVPESTGELPGAPVNREQRRAAAKRKR